MSGQWGTSRFKDWSAVLTSSCPLRFVTGDGDRKGLLPFETVSVNESASRNSLLAPHAAGGTEQVELHGGRNVAVGRASRRRRAGLGGLADGMQCVEVADPTDAKMTVSPPMANWLGGSLAPLPLAPVVAVAGDQLLRLAITHNLQAIAVSFCIVKRFIERSRFRAQCGISSSCTSRCAVT